MVCSVSGHTWASLGPSIRIFLKVGTIISLLFLKRLVYFLAHSRCLRNSCSNKCTHFLFQDETLFSFHVLEGGGDFRSQSRTGPLHCWPQHCITCLGAWPLVLLALGLGEPKPLALEPGLSLPIAFQEVQVSPAGPTAASPEHLQSTGWAPACPGSWAAEPKLGQFCQA